MTIYLIKSESNWLATGQTIQTILYALKDESEAINDCNKLNAQPDELSEYRERIYYYEEATLL